MMLEYKLYLNKGNVGALPKLFKSVYDPWEYIFYPSPQK